MYSNKNEFSSSICEVTFKGEISQKLLLLLQGIDVTFEIPRKVAISQWSRGMSYLDNHPSEFNKWKFTKTALKKWGTIVYWNMKLCYQS